MGMPGACWCPANCGTNPENGPCCGCPCDWPLGGIMEPKFITLWEILMKRRMANMFSILISRKSFSIHTIIIHTTSQKIGSAQFYQLTKSEFWSYSGSRLGFCLETSAWRPLRAAKPLWGNLRGSNRPG